MPSALVTVFAAGSTSVIVGHRHRDGWRFAEHRPQRPRDVGGLDLRGRHLVEQRLELVVVVTVDQRDPHAVLGQLLRARDAGEPATNDNDRGVLNGAHRNDLASSTAIAKSVSRSAQMLSLMILALARSSRALSTSRSHSTAMTASDA